MSEVRIREFREEDKAFIADSWKKSFRWSPCSKWISNGAYYGEMNKRVDDLLSRGRTLVACNPVSDDHIVGWVCVEGDVVHYLYVKTPMRGNGYAKELLRSAIGSIPKPLKISHWTEHCERYANQHGWTYVPSRISK